MRKLSILLFGLTLTLTLTLVLAAPLSAKDIWMVPVHAEPVQLNLTWPVTPYGLARFAFGAPDDMGSFQSAHVVFIPTATASGTYDVYLQVKRDGEAVSAFDIDAETKVPIFFTANQVTEVDVSSVFNGVFDSTSGGNDQVSLIVYAPDSLLNTARVLGLRFTYDPVPVQTAQLANGAVNSAKVADGSLTGADIANGTIGSPDLANSSVTSAKIANGAVGNAALGTGAVTSAKIQNGTIVGADLSTNTISAVHLADEAGVEYAGGTQTFQLGPVAQPVRSIEVNAPVAGFVTVQASGSFELENNNAEGRCGIRTDVILSIPSDATRAALGTVALGVPFLVVPFSVSDGFAVGPGITTFRLVCVSPHLSAKVINSHLTATFSPTRY